MVAEGERHYAQGCECSEHASPRIGGTLVGATSTRKTPKRKDGQPARALHADSRAGKHDRSTAAACGL